MLTNDEVAAIRKRWGWSEKSGNSNATWAASQDIPVLLAERDELLKEIEGLKAGLQECMKVGEALGAGTARYRISAFDGGRQIRDIVRNAMKESKPC